MNRFYGHCVLGGRVDSLTSSRTNVPRATKFIFPDREKPAVEGAGIEVKNFAERRFFCFVPGSLR